MSPNLPSSSFANPPIATLLKVVTTRSRPLRENTRTGIKKQATKKRRYEFGRISQPRAEAASPCVIVQNKISEIASGMVKRNANRYVAK